VSAVVPTTSPLDRIATARANGFGLAVVAGPAAGAGWRAAHDVAPLDALVARTERALHPAPPAVAAAWHLEKHAWHAASLVLAALLVDGSLPPLGGAQVLDGPHGWTDAIAVRPGGWARGAAPVDAAELLEAHLAPVIGALAGRRAERALWREAADRVGQATLWCGEAFGRRADAWAAGAALLSAHTRLRAHAGFVLRDGEPFRRRGGCCLSYRCADGVLCDDCPLRRG
jgi:hypothetical protein